MNPAWVPILCYHRVAPEEDFGPFRSLCVTPEKFAFQMGLLKFLGYTALSIQNLVAYLRLQKNIPSKSVVLTFDDGYADNHAHAFPVLKKYGFIANIFLVTDGIGKVNAWDQGDKPLLKEDQIREMAGAGTIFGSHTAGHIDMTQAGPAQIKAELERSKKKIEDLTRRKDVPFCYPYARLNGEAKRWVREAGYLCGLAGDSGPLDQSRDLFELRRIQIFPSTSLLGFWKKLQPWYPRWAGFQRQVKAARR